MTPSHGSAGQIARINILLLAATTGIFIAWRLWPENPYWWPFGALSVLLAAAAAGAYVNAFGIMLRLHRRKRAVKRFLARGGAPKAARLATRADLEKAGMFDD